MESANSEAESTGTAPSIYHQLPVFGPEGLSLALEASRVLAGEQSYFTLRALNNDILLYVDIAWDRSEITLSSCVDGNWLSKVVQRVAIPGDSIQVGLAIKRDVIIVSIDENRLLDWPLPRTLPKVDALQGEGLWSIKSTDSMAHLEAIVPNVPVENDLLSVSQHDLIFDFGMHNGDDTDYYLKKGFRVVSVDANPALCAKAALRFRDAIEGKRLTICNTGVARARGELLFYVNKQISEWSSFDREFASRGHPVVEVKVPTTWPEDFFRAFGVPYYCKIDIEGFDRLVVDAVTNLPVKPRFVSFENGDLRDFDALVTAGYTRFMLVEQSTLSKVKLPHPSREGADIDHVFPPGSSGPFGNDLEGDWHGVDEMREILEAHHRDLAARSERGHDWWDLHAAMRTIKSKCPSNAGNTPD